MARPQKNPSRVQLWALRILIKIGLSRNECARELNERAETITRWVKENHRLKERRELLRQLKVSTKRRQKHKR